MEEILNCFETYEEIVELIKKEPNSAINWLKYGNLECRSGNFEKGIEYYKKTLELDSNLKIAWFYMGNIYIELKKYEEAEIVLEKIIDEKLDIDRGDLFYSLGISCMELKKYSKAINYFKEILKIEPDDKFAQIKIEEIKKISKEI